MEEYIAVIGLGAIGTPIAHKLYSEYKERFVLVADEYHKQKLQKRCLWVNGNIFTPRIVSNRSQLNGQVEYLFVCTKNYDLESVNEVLNSIITPNTVIIPLQNGVYAYDFFQKAYPENRIIRGFVQGPNTRKQENEIVYTNAGVMHIGPDERTMEETVKLCYDMLKKAKIDVEYEAEIQRMVWKKWMLNVIGNSITALTDSEYSMFKECSLLQDVCRKGMREFIEIAQCEGIKLGEADVEDNIAYYVNYHGTKVTSMLEDVRKLRKTENEYLAGNALQLAQKHRITCPTIELLFQLLEIKEHIYLQKSGGEEFGK